MGKGRGGKGKVCLQVNVGDGRGGGGRGGESYASWELRESKSSSAVSEALSRVYISCAVWSHTY